MSLERTIYSFYLETGAKKNWIFKKLW